MGEAKRKRERRAKSAMEWNFSTFSTIEDRIRLLREPWARPLAEQLLAKSGCECVKCGVEMMSPSATVGPEVIGWGEYRSDKDGGMKVIVLMLCRPCASAADTLEGMARIATMSFGDIMAQKSGGEFWTEPVLHNVPKTRQ